VWEYILDQSSADFNFEAFDTSFCLVGHSHLPLMFWRDAENNHSIPVPIQWAHTMPLTPRRILNPGSVGQPRDMDSRAAYAILDPEAHTWQARRVVYDIAQAAASAAPPERRRCADRGMVAGNFPRAPPSEVDAIRPEEENLYEECWRFVLL
jgi:diadenosine tetraphosphatase ApaH/serine/threonine PP2A family protein phosphatase